MMTYPKEITEAIAKIMGADLYVQKRGRNQFHGYKYATVGDLLDKVQPLMAEAGLVIFQHEAGQDIIDNGNVMTVSYEFTMAHTSGAVWPEKPKHTGMAACRNSKGGFDDKAANKCHTAARKYFLLGLFQVPTGDDYREAVLDGDADAQDHAPPPRSNGKSPTFPEPRPAAPPHDPETGEIAPHAVAFDGNWVTWGQALIAAFKTADTLAELNEWQHKNAKQLGEAANHAPKAHRSVIGALETARKRFLTEGSPEMISEEDANHALQG